MAAPESPPSPVVSYFRYDRRVKSQLEFPISHDDLRQGQMQITQPIFLIRRYSWRLGALCGPRL